MTSDFQKYQASRNYESRRASRRRYALWALFIILIAGFLLGVLAVVVPS